VRIGSGQSVAAAQRRSFACRRSQHGAVACGRIPGVAVADDLLAHRGMPAVGADQRRGCDARTAPSSTLTLSSRDRSRSPAVGAQLEPVRARLDASSSERWISARFVTRVGCRSARGSARRAEWSIFHRSLLERVQARTDRLELRTHSKVTASISGTKRERGTGGGARIAAAALVGADGWHSAVREQIVGDGEPRYPATCATAPCWRSTTCRRICAGRRDALGRTQYAHRHYPLRGWKLSTWSQRWCASTPAQGTTMRRRRRKCCRFSPGIATSRLRSARFPKPSGAGCCASANRWRTGAWVR